MEMKLEGFYVARGLSFRLVACVQAECSGGDTYHSLIGRATVYLFMEMRRPNTIWQGGRVHGAALRPDARTTCTL
jgi:hypothetical protein